MVLANPNRSFQTSRRGALRTLGALTGSALFHPLPALSPSAMAADDVQMRQQGTVLCGRFAAATVHPLATQAAKLAFDQGGNAFDAAVAAAFMLGVVDGHNSGIGGGCFVLARTAAGKLIALDGRETAPALAHRDMFVRNGVVDPVASKVGSLASGVPGQVAALSRLSAEFGRLGWEGGLMQASRVAGDGFAIGANTASAIRGVAARLRQFPASRSLLLTRDGAPLAAGSTLRQPDLANTLASLAENGADWFYNGPFAAACDTWMRQNGGLMRRVDFGDYAAKDRQPLVTSYRNWQVIGFPPPSSGGIHIAQMLMMLERFDIQKLFADEPAVAVHVLAEVMKRAFADRAYWLGDSDYVDVPTGLIDRQYCHDLAASIELSRATAVDSHGNPPLANENRFPRQHTTHLTTADAEGNWVAITNTVNTTFGSCVVIPGTGVVMNNQMDDFSIAVGVPNAFGLIGAEANAIAPGKRPLSSMSPTIVLDDHGQPRLTCGAAGGPRIINAVLQTIIGVLDRSLSVEAAIAAPRVHHQWAPDELVMEPEWDEAVVKTVRSFGHSLAGPARLAVAQAIEQTPSGQLEAASDPRLQIVNTAARSR